MTNGRAIVRRTNGFSMVELSVVIGIAMILLGLGVPGFFVLVHKEKLTTVANSFLNAINLARSEAIHRSGRVDLVPAGGGGDWSEGWVVFIDGNGNQKPEAGERIILAHGAVPADIAIEASFTDSTVQYLAYTGTGRTRTNASSQAPQLGSVTFTGNGQVRRIKLNFLGRARICNPATDGASC